MPTHVSCTVTDGVATLLLRNAERRNAVSVDLLDGLDRTLAELEGNRSVRVVVVTGDGPAFSVGADLAAPPAQRSLRGESVPADLSRLRHAGRIVERLHHLPQVTVAAVNGACAGAGLALALACDLRIAAEKAVFNTAFLSAGLSGDFGGIWFAARILGAAKAKELFLLPEKLPAPMAHAAGLVTFVAEGADFDAATCRLANRLARSAPRAAQAMKQNFYAAESMTLADYLRVESERMVATFHTEDAREAGRAFLEQREPVFTGRDASGSP